MELIESIVSRENLIKALSKVESNKGAPGIDGVTTKDLRVYCQTHWPRIKQEILQGMYKPNPVRTVAIPKASGGKRQLGIPTVIDRLIQQAILQVLTPIFDPGFSQSSFGFRPHRRGHDAVRQARGYAKDGYAFVVDLDLEQFFDRINHDVLMSKVTRKVQDKPVLKLIRAYLQCGIMQQGVCVRTEVGTPQGGPLSPLLANILLDDLDKELEQRKLRFCRYADDCNIYVHSKRAGERVKQSITKFLKQKLRLTVNEKKSAVDRPWKRTFLGFSVTSDRQLKIRIAKTSLNQVKDTIRSMTKSSRGISMQQRTTKLNQYLMGWMGYFALCETPTVIEELDKWTRRRMRLCQWIQWKKAKTKYRHLRNLGLDHGEAYKTAQCHRGNWWIVKTPIIQKTLDRAYWQDQGLQSLLERYKELRQDWRTAGCGPACPVV